MVDVLGVNIESDEIVQFLKKNIQLKEICHKILSQKIVNRTAQTRNITVTTEEIQGEADALRRQKRLEKAADTFAWLSGQLITSEDWEAGIRDRLLTEKLALSLFAKDVERYFAEHRLDFEQALLYQIVVPYEQLAWEIFYQIEEEEMSFYQAAHLYDIDEKRRYYCGYEGKVYRWSLHPDIASRVFNARAGETITPIKTDLGYHLLLVEKLIAPELTPENYQEIIGKLFKEWLVSELNYTLYHSEKNGATKE